MSKERDGRSFIRSVKEFMEVSKQTTGEFNVRQTALYVGLQLEEMAEKLEAVFGGTDATASMLHYESHQFKTGQYDYILRKANREDLLDADIDLAWVSFGSAFSQGADVFGASIEVTTKNLGKFFECPECDGDGWLDELTQCPSCGGFGKVAMKDANGKVKKPAGWTSPDHKPFTCKD